MIDYQIVKGQGNYIFFLHGWGGDKNSFTIIKNCIEENFNMVFVSFSGFGLSKEPLIEYKLNNYVEELESLIKQISDGNKINIVCHSFGCRVATRLINRNPLLVEKLIIVDGAGVKPKRSLKYYYKIAKYKRQKNKVLKGKADSKTLDKYGSTDYKNLSRIMKQTFVNIVNEHQNNEFKNITCKTLIYWGKNDKETPLYMAKFIHKSIKNSVLIVKKNSGHFSYIENYIDFTNHLEEFMLFS